jgi:hypothetical protein
MTIAVRHSPELLEHLRTHEVDGATVEAVLFEGGRLHYPERRHLEHTLGFIEPYLLDHEARVIEGMDPRWNAACLFLARVASKRHGDDDPTLALLWESHTAFFSTRVSDPPSLDRLVAALVTVKEALNLVISGTPPTLVTAVTNLVKGLQVMGFPPSSDALEEICDGAVPACVGLGLVDIDWRSEK